MILKKIEQKVLELKQAELYKLLNQCTRYQQDLFKVLFSSVEEIPENEINAALQLCERTVLSNLK